MKISNRTLIIRIEFRFFLRFFVPSMKITNNILHDCAFFFFFFFFFFFVIVFNLLDVMFSMNTFTHTTSHDN